MAVAAAADARCARELFKFKVVRRDSVIERRLGVSAPCPTADEMLEIEWESCWNACAQFNALNGKAQKTRTGDETIQTKRGIGEVGYMWSTGN